MDYVDFLKQKRCQKREKGIEVSIDELNSILFDYQKLCVQKALISRVFCLFEECGMGKSMQQLEYAYQVHKHTHGDVLIVAPLCVAAQTAKEEAPKLGYEVTICRSQKDVKAGINITNYEMLDNFDGDYFVGVVLDESSILKNFVGKTARMINEKFRNTKFKLCCSATPAPNDFDELLNQANFLGIMSTAQARSMFFINDFKTGSWRLKGHATKEFYRWLCTWSVNIKKPSDLGFDDKGYVLPKLNQYTREIEIDEIDDNFENGLFRDISTSATGYQKEKKNTSRARAFVCKKIVEEQPDEQFIIWCYTNDEADWLKHYIHDAVEVRGSESISRKEKATNDFKNGKIRILISKPSIFGLGMNFQNCHNVIFDGLDYSFESYYQALRRVYRFGQKHEVNAWTVIGSTELHILNVIKEKQQKQEEIKNQMDISVNDLQLEILNGMEGKVAISQNVISLPNFI